MSYSRSKKKRVNSPYHLNDNIELIFQEPSLLNQYQYDSTFEHAPRSKRIYEEVIKEQEFLRNARTVWMNKLKCLQEDRRLFEKMQQCSKESLANVPPLFDRNTIFKSSNDSTDNTAIATATTLNSTTAGNSNASGSNNDNDNDIDDSTHPQAPSASSSLSNFPVEHVLPRPATTSLSPTPSPSSPVSVSSSSPAVPAVPAVPDIDLSILEGEVDENDDEAVRRALDLMLRQFGDHL